MIIIMNTLLFGVIYKIFNFLYFIFFYSNSIGSKLTLSDRPEDWL